MAETLRDVLRGGGAPASQGYTPEQNINRDVTLTDIFGFAVSGPEGTPASRAAQMPVSAVVPSDSPYQAIAGERKLGEAFEPMVAQRLAQLAHSPVIDNIRDERRKMLVEQFLNMRSVKERFGQGIPTTPEGERGPAGKRDLNAVVSFVKGRKNQLMGPREWGGGNMTVGPAHAQALAEARVAFPHVRMADILAAVSQHPETSATGVAGTDVSPIRATGLSDSAILEVLQDPSTHTLLEQARNHQRSRPSGIAQSFPTAETFVEEVAATLAAEAKSGLDAEAAEAFNASGFTSEMEWARSFIRTNLADKLSVVTALTGLY